MKMWKKNMHVYWYTKYCAADPSFVNNTIVQRKIFVFFPVDLTN